MNKIDGDLSPLAMPGDLALFEYGRRFLLLASVLLLGSLLVLGTLLLGQAVATGKVRLQDIVLSLAAIVTVIGLARFGPRTLSTLAKGAFSKQLSIREVDIYSSYALAAMREFTLPAWGASDLLALAQLLGSRASVTGEQAPGAFELNQFVHDVIRVWQEQRQLTERYSLYHVRSVYVFAAFLRKLGQEQRIQWARDDRGDTEPFRQAVLEELQRINRIVDDLERINRVMESAHSRDAEEIGAWGPLKGLRQVVDSLRRSHLILALTSLEAAARERALTLDIRHAVREVQHISNEPAGQRQTWGQ